MNRHMLQYILRIFAYSNKTCTSVSQPTVLLRLHPYSCTFQHAPLMSAMIPIYRPYIIDLTCIRTLRLVSEFQMLLTNAFILLDTPPQTYNCCVQFFSALSYPYHVTTFSKTFKLKTSYPYIDYLDVVLHSRVSYISLVCTKQKLLNSCQSIPTNSL